MIKLLIDFSLKNRLIIVLFIIAWIGFGLYSLSQISIGAVPDITNNQVQVITTSRNLATEEVEKFLTYPVELEMANLPGVKEIRSVSKFGLSVVTVVFEDDLGTYLPRQLIAEKIKAAEERIPAEFGKPFMGPITTGLGEIYQYILEVDEQYRDQYDLTDLRTIQDWVVRRQLSGIPGVVEVNTWGGYLKQFEVAVDPHRLQALDLSLGEVFKAVESNNAVAGGAYIEKAGLSYFVRAEGMVEQLDDLRNTTVAYRGGLPIYLREVAEVNIGHANRFGAITANGEGEKVLGQIMLLKGANVKEVIDAVKERVVDIEKSLPPGIHINGFLERSDLIGKTTNTIIENLVLGCLIVIFVVVLLLGNWRSGLIVASVIPLSLLFALGMMNIFEVDANLMSLGAIDFGIIIDGAVIIVEYIAFQLNRKSSEYLTLNREERQKLKSKISLQAGTKMMHSAIFGQLIIIIVFIPILTLGGVEAKMFRPMALVFSFALTGAMILCLTYVPMMTAWILKPKQSNKPSLGHRIIDAIQKPYQRLLVGALDHPKTSLGLAGLLFAFALTVFLRMGGEFVPTLDEGDFVIQPVFPTGTSLAQTTHYTTEIEKALLEFPEVEQVVTRIGAAEVPTDPMSMEESDVIIKLKPAREWTTAESKDDLANHFKEKIQARLGDIEVEFTQPIEMRFNELITGVRADLAIKIYGEDLDQLQKYADEVAALIQDVPGAADINVEKTVGLPQMNVKYKREALARYGLSIADLNLLINTSFAGKKAGIIFEGEKTFDLVLRLPENLRQSIEDLRQIPVRLAGGQYLPLHHLADISYQKGPAKISRDDTRRRTVVGVNVRDRDLESVVLEIEALLDEKLDLAPGYRLKFGGQFENLQAATARLSIAVPVALVLIFLLLYFAFKSTRDALTIFSAIPFAAVGGVLLLAARGLPFSISAGVGFIALFGIAVLNGIVLIEEFHSLAKKGLDINQQIITGTKLRLRPVLLTASAAALGFFPMAFSQSAGAEVQRPLATVVIGGLVTATFLTLLVLPLLYRWQYQKRSKLQVGKMGMLLLLLSPLASYSQNLPAIGLQEALDTALKNNPQYLGQLAKLEEAEAATGTAWQIEQPTVFYGFDEANIARNDQALQVWGLSQNFRFPTVYFKQKQVLEQNKSRIASETAVAKAMLVKDLRQAYVSLLVSKNLLAKSIELDSLFKMLSRSAEVKISSGELNKLEALRLKAKASTYLLKVQERQSQLEQAELHFNRLLQGEKPYTAKDVSLSDLRFYQPQEQGEFLSLMASRKAIDQAQAEISRQKQEFTPDIQVSVFQGNNRGPEAIPYNGIQAGLTIPLWFGASAAELKASKARLRQREWSYLNLKSELENRRASLLLQHQQGKQRLSYYRTEGKSLTQELKQQAKVQFQAGEISIAEYAQLLEEALLVEENYLATLKQQLILETELDFLQ